MIIRNAIELIGNTPIVKLKNEEIYVKMEKFNPGGSIKDRTALGMINDALNSGMITKGDCIIEPTSGNTGIGLAIIGKQMGLKVIIVMPESMSEERKKLIKSCGAELILTDGKLGMKGAIEMAEKLVRENPNYYMLDQFNNKSNVNIHYNTTANEIIRDLSDVDIFVTSVGTGGTFTGIARRLKEINNKIITIAVEPEKSAVLSGGKPNSHNIQGIGAGFIPSIFDISCADEIMTIGDEESVGTAIEISQQLGTLIGISSGANIAAARKAALKYGTNKKIITISPDGGEKYLSVVDYGVPNLETSLDKIKNEEIEVLARGEE